MHIYEKTNDGVIIPRHFTSYKEPRFDGNGREVLRSATLGDFKKWKRNGEKVAASVTTILDACDSKPALVNWKIDQHLKITHKLHGDVIEKRPENEYIETVKRLTQEAMDKAPRDGSEFHKSMESFIELVQNYAVIDGKTTSLQRTVADLIIDETETHIHNWKTETNIYSPIGYAGQCDLFIPGENPWVIDYKT